jgi:hypothetical protein
MNTQRVEVVADNKNVTLEQSAQRLRYCWC